jgi:microcystin-dependent protein
MTQGLYIWSKTPASNGLADTSVNYQEGQAPSSVNDSARAAMARIAEYRDDIAGAIVTAGTSTAFTVTSNQVFDTLAHMNGQMIAFSPHTTNGATVTLNVDGLGAKPLRSAPSTELLAGVLVQGTPYLALYNNSDAAFYLHGFYGNPYNVPIAAGMDYWAATTPNSSFAFPAGQAISRTTYATLFALISTTYGVGDGSTTFNLPDKTGRTTVMKEASATRLTSTYFGGNSTVLGAVGGLESSTLVTGNLPAYTPSGSIANGAISINAGNAASTVVTAGTVGGGGGFAQLQTPSISASQGTTTFSGSAQGGTSNPVRTVPPSIVANYIIRIL